MARTTLKALGMMLIALSPLAALSAGAGNPSTEPSQLRFVAIYSMSRYGFIDANGTPVVDAKFDEAFPFSEGLAAAREKAFPKNWGFIDGDGQWIIKPQYGHVDSFHEGLAPVQDSSGKWGVIDKSGKWVGRRLPARARSVGDAVRRQREGHCIQSRRGGTLSCI